MGSGAWGRPRSPAGSSTGSGRPQGWGEGVFWFTFQDIRTSEYVINRLVEGLFGTEAMTAPTAQKLEDLIKTLKAHRVLIVWDNFESVSGIPGVIEGHLPPEDRAHLAILLKACAADRARSSSPAAARKPGSGASTASSCRSGAYTGRNVGRSAPPS